MPGMMDTVLNIGLNDETAEAMVRLTGDERFVFDAYRRLIQMFGTVVMGLDDEPFEEILSQVAQGQHWRGQIRHYYTVPWGPYYIWGATAAMLMMVACSLSGSGMLRR